MIAAHIWNASFPGAAFTQVSAIQATNQTLVTSRSRATRSVKPEATEAAEAAEAATHRHLRLQIYLDGHIQLASRKRHRAARQGHHTQHSPLLFMRNYI